MERRRESRLGMELPGSYRLGEDGSRPVYVSQISSKGCRVCEEELSLAVGDVIKLALGAIETVEATVKWTLDNLAGVEFSEPLDECILEFFAAYCPRVA